MSSSIIDFINCHTEKILGHTKYINDKCLDVKEVNSEKIYQDGVLVATQTEIDILQQEIDNISPSNPNSWINGLGQTTTNQQILFTDNSQNGAITSDKLYFDTTNNWIILDGSIVPVRSEIDYINEQINTIHGEVNGLTSYTLGLSQRIDTLETLTTTQGNDITTNATNITIIEGQVSTLENQVLTNTNQILNLTNRTNDLETLTSAQQTDIINLQTNVSTNTSDISTLQTNVSNNTTDISNLQTNVSNNTSNISTLQTNVSTNTNDIITLQGDISNLQTTTASQQTQINTNTSNISTNTSNISTNTSNINTINNKLNSSLYNYYVSSQSGSDLTGDGTLYNSWKTIGKAITVINTLSADTPVVINLSAGNYTENITITKNNVSISGSNAIATTITGNILFDMAQGTGFYSIGLLSNLTIIGGWVEHRNSTNYNNTLSISNVISATANGKNNFIFQTTGVGLLGDCTMNNCVVYANADTSPVLVNNSALFMVGCQIQNSLVLGSTIQNYIYVSGAGRCNLFGCSLYNGSTSANVKALIEVANTSTVTSSTTINNCILMFTSPTSTTTGSIMTFSNSSSSNTVNFYNNYVKSNVSTGAPNNYIVLKTSSNVGSTVNFTFGNCIGGNVSHTVPNTGYVVGWTKTAMNPVV